MDQTGLPGCLQKTRDLQWRVSSNIATLGTYWQLVRFFCGLGYIQDLSEAELHESKCSYKSFWYQVLDALGPHDILCIAATRRWRQYLCLCVSGTKLEKLGCLSRGLCALLTRIHQINQVQLTDVALRQCKREKWIKNGFDMVFWFCVLGSSVCCWQENSEWAKQSCTMRSTPACFCWKITSNNQHCSQMVKWK